MLFVFCFANETFFVALYLLHFYSTPLGLPAHAVSSLFPPGVLLNQPKLLAAVDGFVANLSVPLITAVLCFPIMFTKQVINVVQFWKASKIVRRS